MFEVEQVVETTNLSDILGITEQFFQCLHQSQATIKTFMQGSSSVSCLGGLRATPREQPCDVEKGLSHEIPRVYIHPAKRDQEGTALLHLYCCQANLYGHTEGPLTGGGPSELQLGCREL